MISKTTLMVVCFGFIAMNAKNYVSGTFAHKKAYNSKTQVCCNGYVQGTVEGQPACCGSNAYDALTQQCCDDGFTVIPQTDAKNNTLTCCGGKPVIADYNQMCCGGTLSDRPRVTSPSDTFACCNDQIYLEQRESCCNGVVSPDANKVLQCCNDQTSHDSTSQICCGETVVDVPDDVIWYDYGCCDNEGFDVNLEICDWTTSIIFSKPADASCPGLYTQVCGGKVLNPNEQCCNNESFVAPTVWIDDGTGTGGGYPLQIAYCCPNGQGIVEDPRTETCCSDPKVGVLPIDLPSQICCDNQIMDVNVNTCCDDTIQPGPSSSTGCCDRTSYDYQTQLCCLGVVYEMSDGYDSCCYAD